MFPGFKKLWKYKTAWLLGYKCKNKACKQINFLLKDLEQSVDSLQTNPNLNQTG